jgi:hypothetical protein
MDVASVARALNYDKEITLQGVIQKTGGHHKTFVKHLEDQPLTEAGWLSVHFRAAARQVYARLVNCTGIRMGNLWQVFNSVFNSNMLSTLTSIR